MLLYAVRQHDLMLEYGLCSAAAHQYPACYHTPPGSLDSLLSKHGKQTPTPSLPHRALFTYSCTQRTVGGSLPCRPSRLPCTGLAALPQKGPANRRQQVQLCASQVQLDSLSCRSAASDMSATCLTPPRRSGTT